MRKLTAITHVTLDGIMQAPGGPEEDPRGGFTQGGWAMRFSDEAGGEALGEIMSGEFDLLLRRRDVIRGSEAQRRCPRDTPKESHCTSTCFIKASGFVPCTHEKGPRRALSLCFNWWAVLGLNQ